METIKIVIIVCLCLLIVGLGYMIMTKKESFTECSYENMNNDAMDDYATINDGTGFSAESTVRLADIYSFSDNSGLFFGGSLEGSYLQPRNDLNFAIHRKHFLSDEILKTSTLNDKARDLVKLILDISNDTKKQ